MSKAKRLRLLTGTFLVALSITLTGAACQGGGGDQKKDDQKKEDTAKKDDQKTDQKKDDQKK